MGTTNPTHRDKKWIGTTDSHQNSQTILPSPIFNIGSEKKQQIGRSIQKRTRNHNRISSFNPLDAVGSESQGKKTLNPQINFNTLFDQHTLMGRPMKLQVRPNLIKRIEGESVTNHDDD